MDTLLRALTAPGALFMTNVPTICVTLLSYCIPFKNTEGAGTHKHRFKNSICVSITPHYM